MPENNPLIILRQNLNTYFDLNELRGLCFDLGVDSEQLSVRSLSKDEFVRELLRHEAQQERLHLLVAACTKLRPNTEWPLPNAEAVNAWLQTISLPPEKVNRRRNQIILLEKVKNFWIQGVLEKSITETGHVGIRSITYNDAIDHPWHEIVDTVVYDTQALTLHDTLLDTFNEADRALLILGAAGTGKSTTLLNLSRELVFLAEKAPTQPVPVVLSLVSWAEKRESIGEWIIGELNDKYQIPKQMASEWLAADELVLMLDSLDEVPLRYRDDCINALNQFRANHGLTGLAVCSRINEYEAVGVKLKLSGAILLQQLTSDQIDTYLKEAGPKYAALYLALQQDKMLQELAISPLMLNIMIKAYSEEGESVKDKDRWRSGLNQLNTNEEYRQHLFSTYVKRMFQRSSNKLYRENQTIVWLTWLARNMSQHNQAIFLVESLQPSWLPTWSWRWFYILTTRLLDGIYIGLLLWLYLENKQGTSQFVDAFTGISQRFGIFTSLGDLWPVIFLNVILGLMSGVLQIGWFEHAKSHSNSSLTYRKRWQMAVVNGIVVGLASLIIIAVLGYPFESLSWGALECVLFILASLLFHGTSYRDDVRSVEALHWIWSDAIKAGLLGLIAGVISGSIGLLIYDSTAGFLAIPTWVLLFALLAGLRGKKIETKSVPNQGIHLSARNGLKAAFLYFLPFTLFGFILYGGFGAAIVAGFTAALGAFLAYGGSNIVKHYLVGMILWLTGKIPRTYPHFLDSSVERLFLYRVGGGYIFIHRLLQDYFSRLADEKDV
ncbi:MAG: hypothetical protein R6X34_01905 [Chloroflexota bacterium]